MRIRLNGEAVDTAAADLQRFVEAVGFDPAIVATALNGEFVPRPDRAATALKDGDEVEVFSPRQGG